MHRFFSLAVILLLVAREARADESSFMLSVSSGVGPGFYHYLSGTGKAGATDFAGVDVAFDLCIGGHGSHVGFGFDLMTTPTFASWSSPGGAVGACFVVQPTRAFRVDLTAGFGANGAPGVFGGIGPVWSIGFTFALARGTHSSFDFGLRFITGYHWEPDTKTQDPGVYLSPTASLGYSFW